MVSSGWRLLWRRQRLLWWVYLLSLVLGFFSAYPVVSMIGPVLDHSLAAEPLYRGFDVATLGALLMRPEVAPATPAMAAAFFAAIFLVLMLLLTGGILKVYNEDRTFGTGEFFSAGGEYFWRFVRLVVFLLIVLIPIGILNWGFKTWSGHLADELAQPAPGVAVRLAGALLVLLALMGARLWFDMAEIHAVAEGEYAMRRALGCAWRLVRAHLGSLFWLYFRLSLLMWVGAALLLWVWVRFVAHEALTTSLILTQAVVFWWILTRLWQRSSETLWYQQHAAVPWVEPPPISSARMAEPPGSSQAPPSEMPI